MKDTVNTYLVDDILGEIYVPSKYSQKIFISVSWDVFPSVEQGFWKPRGYVGKGLEGRGQGTERLTPHKPLPMSTGKGIPLLLQAGKFAPVF